MFLNIVVTLAVDSERLLVGLECELSVGFGGQLDRGKLRWG